MGSISIYYGIVDFVFAIKLSLYQWFLAPFVGSIFVICFVRHQLCSNLELQLLPAGI